MSTYIGKVSIDGAPEIPVGSTLYGICDTVADTGTKVVKLDNFDELINGVTVHVKFTYGNRAAMTNSFTLKVGTTSAKVIKNPGGSVAWQAGAVISFTYDATANQWSVNDSTASATNVSDTYDPSSSDPISGQGVAVAMNYLGDAAWKGVVEEIIEEGNTTNKDSTDLPTTAAIINYVDSRPTGLRIYRQSMGFNVDLPLVVSRTAAANLGMGGINNSYTDGVYGIVWTETEKIPTLNPSTGLMKAAAYQGSGEYLTNLNATNILSGTLAVARLADSGATAGAYGPIQNTQIDFGESISIPYLVVDVKGRITAIESRTIRLPQSDNMDMKAGQYGTNAAREYSLLMKKSDNNDNEIDYVQFSSNNAVTLNPSLGRITAPGGFVGKATSSETADIANAVSWVNVADRPSLIIAGLTLGLAGDNNSFEITAAQLRYNLGLSNALHFIGQVPTVNG